MPLLNERTDIKTLEINLHSGSGIGARVEKSLLIWFWQKSSSVKTVEHFGPLHVFKIKSVFWTCVCLFCLVCLCKCDLQNREIQAFCLEFVKGGSYPKMFPRDNEASWGADLVPPFLWSGCFMSADCGHLYGCTTRNHTWDLRFGPNLQRHEMELVPVKHDLGS